MTTIPAGSSSPAPDRPGSATWPPTMAHGFAAASPDRLRSSQR